MAAATQLHAPKVSSPKDLYEIGEVPPLGHVPAKMHAWAIRKERHGPPESSMQLEVVPTWTIGEDEVLVYVMAGGVNYNGVWAGLGQPIFGHQTPDGWPDTGDKWMNTGAIMQRINFGFVAASGRVPGAAPSGFPGADALKNAPLEQQVDAVASALLGGSISAEHGVGSLKVDSLPKYKDPVALGLMARIKRSLDPQGLLNPGRVIRTD